MQAHSHSAMSPSVSGPRALWHADWSIEGSNHQTLRDPDEKASSDSRSMVSPTERFGFASSA